MNNKHLEAYKIRYHVFLSTMYRLHVVLGIIHTETASTMDLWDDLAFWPDAQWLDGRMMKDLEDNIRENIRGWISEMKEQRGLPCLPFRVPPRLQDYAEFMAMKYVDENYKRPEKMGVYQQEMMRQSLVMVIATLEAFLVDSVKTVCKVQPEVMKSKKSEIEWRSIIDAGSFDEVMELLAGLFYKEFPGDFSSGVNMMRKKFEIKVEFPEDGLRKLDDARNLRHITVHNGGRADKRFLKNTRWKDPVGEKVKIELDWLGEVWELTCGLATIIYFDVVRKFLKVEPETMVYWEPL